MSKIPRAPDIKDAVVLEVYVAAAGRCSFYGCQDYVLKEPLTKKTAILGNVAHIVGASRSKTSPRGDDPLPLQKRSEIENLMLMCTKHHAFIDKRKNWFEYPVEVLRVWKRKHEARMRLQTGIPLDAKTHALRFFGQVRGNRFGISDAEINSAVFKHEKRYVDEKVFDIDMIGTADAGDKSYWKAGKDKIDEVLKEELMPKIGRGDIDRLSIFGLARIPLLAYLGYRLGDKVPSVLYQKHKDDGEGWSWPAREPEIRFQVISHGGRLRSRVSVLISVSGGDITKARKAAPNSTLYEIRPVGETPRLTLLGSPKTLENFRRAYRDFLSNIEATHPRAERIDCFIAGPAPVALICGRELRAEVPKVIIHDLIDGAYKPAIIFG